MEVDKLGPPEARHGGIDFDIYFRLNKPEADTISDPVTQAVIAAKLAVAAPPFGAVAAVLVLNYIAQIKANTGPNGCSVKSTLVSKLGGVTMKEFIAEPI